VITEALTDLELQSFTSKLEAFTRELTPKEQSLFTAILWRAADDGEGDVEGHHWMVDPYTAHLSWQALHHLMHLIALRTAHVAGASFPPVKLP
jgi:hypothetical protein